MRWKGYLSEDGRAVDMGNKGAGELFGLVTKMEEDLGVGLEALNKMDIRLLEHEGRFRALEGLNTCARERVSLLESCEAMHEARLRAIERRLGLPLPPDKVEAGPSPLSCKRTPNLAKYAVHVESGHFLVEEIAAVEVRGGRVYVISYGYGGARERVMDCCEGLVLSHFGLARIEEKREG